MGDKGHGLNGTEAKAGLETMVPLHILSPHPRRGALLWLWLDLGKGLCLLGPLESPPMTLGWPCLCSAGQASVPVPCWKGRQVWLPHRLRPTRGQCWAGCPSSQATPTRAPQNCPALLALGNSLSSSSLPLGSAQSWAKSMQDTHTARAVPLDPLQPQMWPEFSAQPKPQAPSRSTCSQTTSF